jgi:hypothetical protein
MRRGVRILFCAKLFCLTATLRSMPAEIAI